MREPGRAQNACEHPTTRGRRGTLPAHRGQGHRPLSRNRGACPTLWPCSVRDLRLSPSQGSVGSGLPRRGAPGPGRSPPGRGGYNKRPPPPRHGEWAGLQPGTCTYRPARPRPGADGFRWALCPPGDHGDRKEQELPSSGLSLLPPGQSPTNQAPLGLRTSQGSCWGCGLCSQGRHPPRSGGLTPILETQSRVGETSSQAPRTGRP